MKKRTPARKKVVSSKTKKSTPQVITFHRIFVYTAGGIAAVTLLFAIAHVTFQQSTTKVDSLYATNVLGEEDSNSGSGKQGDDKSSEEQKHNDEQATEQAKHEAEQRIEQQKEQRPTVAPNSFKVQTQREGRKSETEIETADGQKIKTKVEDDGSAKIEFEHKKLKIHYEIHNGTVSATAKDDEGRDVELDEDELSEVENSLEDDGIKIATGEAGTLTFAKNKFKARTHFPLAIDTGTNQLVVTTPAGQKVVTVLPDVAVQNMLATGVIHALQTGDSGTESGNVEFTIENNEPVYKIAGLKKFKFLGFIPVSQPVTAVVSSETGEEVKTEEPFFTQFVDLLSP